MPKQQTKTLSAEDKRDLRNAKRLARPKFGNSSSRTTGQKIDQQRSYREETQVDPKLSKTTKLCGVEKPMKQLELDFNTRQKQWNCAQKSSKMKSFGLQKKRENLLRKKLNLPSYVQPTVFSKPKGPYETLIDQHPRKKIIK